MKILFTLLFIFIYVAGARHRNRTYVVNSFRNDASIRRYKPSWEDLDTRPLPQWYDKAKVGIFLHWGLYSVPGFQSEWFWHYWDSGQDSYVQFMKKNYPRRFSYQDFAPMFQAEFFDPNDWADLFVKSGAKYIILTSKHHEGYTLFPSKRSFGWNSVDIGPRCDLVGDVAKAVRKRGLKFGVYHSLFEWFNPIYLEDKRSFYLERNYVTSKLWPDLKQLVTDYKPSVIWSDGDWEAFDAYWNSTGFLAWLYNDSPVAGEVVVNDRWGIGIPCHHGDFYNCADKYNPGTLQSHKWENAFTVDKMSWGYRRNIKLDDVLTIDDILKQLVSTVSCGGNVLINVGPTKEGTICPIFQERLLSLGSWLNVNGEAIYGTSPWHHQNDTINGDVWYTCTVTKYRPSFPTAIPGKDDNIEAVYAIFLKWPIGNVLKVKDLSKLLQDQEHELQLLGNTDYVLKWKIVNGTVNIQLPERATVTSQHAWTLRVTQKTG